ncbi:MAG: glycogen/starch/alpha-glucan phosphorylase [Opitutales bacterium]|nr:glycogen/starch/alpha-glucan phosphorylase [Opitutales bacterium]
MPKAPRKKAASKRSATKNSRNVVAELDSSVKGIQQSIANHLRFTLARDIKTASKREWYLALTFAVRERMLENYIQTQERHNGQNVRRAYYLSMEYLMGRLLSNNLHNVGIFNDTREALKNLGVDIEELIAEEHDMGLGNGGLGRLAACFLDSIASLNLPAIGYGIHYEFGLFRQRFNNGYQIEGPDNWREFGDPWEICRPQYMVDVKIYGRVSHKHDAKGDYSPEWVDVTTVRALPFDVPIVGYGAKTVNFLRLWEAKASESFNLETFNQGGYVEAVRDKATSETISKVLYPNDSTASGKELRLVQEYFFVSASLQDIIRRHFRSNNGWDSFPEKVAIQLNDTHPAVAVAELMRLLVDEHAYSWDPAWDLVRKTFAYTNHTLLPEALEKWSVPLFEKVLPRHMEIIFELNRRFLEDEVEARWPGSGAMKSRLSLIEEGNPKQVRMAYLSVIGSHTVNGVAALHTQLLKKDLFHDFDTLYPGKFQNKTNGITPRRWLLACNERLSDLITSKIGEDWPRDLDQLRQIAEYADEASFQKAFMAVKRANKVRLADYVEEHMGLTISPDAMFDVQIKRLHEYKRQHLNLLHILTLYRDILHNPDGDFTPRVFIFAAKAAPGYDLAKNILRAINKVGEVINNDTRVGDKLKIVFPENYSVSLAEIIIPAADVSEQISTAGKEASGTGNMKLALNGAVTIGTLDGANVEIREEVGDENIFIFGLRVEEVQALKAQGYNPWKYYHANANLKSAIDWLASGHFTPGEVGAFDTFIKSLLEDGDPFLVLADYQDYCATQTRVGEAFKDPSEWARMAILNTARVGKFSSDRTISEYAKEIWNLEPCE